ncbi:UDP-N-acetylmuramoyl-L-alanyl-D-glutamate--2,6-diaminopimelate ligase [Candidatus Dojkabacteria bacterium]|nr:UDP-N-acetylmuramoyl-L-alanyl-D-glutamate--2,6-diaminopimelate ligase [Candidatus Dojkabacteria bacterium]
MQFIIRKIKNLLHWLESQFYNILYGLPSRRLKIISITGTDGKTTTCTLIYEIFVNAGKKAGLMTTVEAKIDQETFSTGFHTTTPDSKKLYEFIQKMIEVDTEYAVVETTSHALDQNRTKGIKSIAVGYTNITNEHLDYHKNIKSYIRAKLKILNQVSKSGFAVLNKDDDAFGRFERKARNRNIPYYSYSLRSGADFVAENIQQSGDSQLFNLKINGQSKGQFELGVPGEYNMQNALAAVAVTYSLGIPIQAIGEALANFKGAKGRWEVVVEKPFKVVVDFAHTPNALKQVILQGRSQTPKNRKLIVVFGCTGERDPSKRPVMGKYAGDLADVIIATSDDTRTEKIEDINEQIHQGVCTTNKTEGEDYFRIGDRRQAIEKALELADRGDVVLLCGKGHETTLNLDGKTEIPWSDKKVALEILKSNGVIR